MLEPIPFAGMVEIDESFDRTASHMAGEYVPYNELVAWAYIKDGEFLDAIHPDEHAQEEGSYNISLYTAEQIHPVKELTDEEIQELAEYHGIDSLYETGRLDFARAILRKAQEK